VAETDAPVQHGMLPGSHEWPRTPECRCGERWDWSEERCVTEPDWECTDACPEDCTADHRGEQ